MRNLFLIILSGLVIFSQIISWRSSGKPDAGKNVVYWVTDNNPARAQQVALFKSWLKKRGYPDIDLRIDVNNQGVQKTIIQGVTGTAGDCIDIPAQSLSYLNRIGIVDTVTNLEEKFGYPDRQVFAPLSNYIFEDGKQFAFPCSISVFGLLVNEDTLKKAGLSSLPFSMSFETFEAVGKTFVARAGRDTHGSFYFVGNLNPEALRRTAGVSTFNETLTAPALGSPEHVRVLQLIFKWTYEDHLAPSAGELSSFATEDGYGGPLGQLLVSGRIAMMESGRHLMILTRNLKIAPQWNAILHPHGGYPNAIANSRAVVLYKGSKNPEAASYFLGFLRSDEYSLLMATESDAIPPNPAFLSREEFLRPKAHPNEWNLHSAFARMALEFSIPRDISPFAMNENHSRAEQRIYQAFMNKIHTAEQAVDLMDRAIRAEVDRFIKSHPEAVPKFQDAQARQKVIDAAKVSGKKIPLALVDNPFLKRYYLDTGKGE